MQEYFDSLTEDLIEVTHTDIENEITGPQETYPYENYRFSVEDISGTFSIDDDSKAKIVNQENGWCEIEILSSKKGNFNLVYTTDENTYVFVRAIDSSIEEKNEDENKKEIVTTKKKTSIITIIIRILLLVIILFLLFLFLIL